MTILSRSPTKFGIVGSFNMVLVMFSFMMGASVSLSIPVLVPVGCRCIISQIPGKPGIMDITAIASDGAAPSQCVNKVQITSQKSGIQIFNTIVSVYFSILFCFVGSGVGGRVSHGQTAEHRAAQRAF